MRKVFLLFGIVVFLFGICFADDGIIRGNFPLDNDTESETSELIEDEPQIDEVPEQSDSVNAAIVTDDIESSVDYDSDGVSFGNGNAVEIYEGEDETVERKTVKKKSRAGYADVPNAKRPKAPDKEKSEAAAKKDESDKTIDEYKKTLKYGVASEISTLIDKLVSNEDPRFADDLYDLFQETKSTEVKEKVLNYFKKLEDPCLEDFAVMVLNDPYDEKNSTVKACFQYVSAVKCTAAAPAVLLLIENENEDYFNDALLAIGDIGGPDEALFLAEYLERSDLTTAQRQSLMKMLGKIHAVETWDKLVEIAENEDENLFVRMYAAEAIGAMEKKESIPVLKKLFEESDPNLRQYVIKGLSYFFDDADAKEIIIQAIRDDHYKVRLEAIDAVKKFDYKDAMPYLIYRSQNDSEVKVKQNCYAVIAYLNTNEGNDFLIERVTEKKGSDTLKTKAVESLLKENHAGISEIKDFVLQIAEDDRRKTLRSSVGKLIAKYPNDEFGEVCVKFLESKDTTTQSLGLDMYQSGKYADAVPYLQKIVGDRKANTSNKRRAQKLLGIEEE